MKRPSFSRTRAVAVLGLLLTTMVLVVPQVARPDIGSAQGSTPKPVSLCGTILQFLGPTATSLGSIQISSAGTSVTFPIASQATYTPPPATAIGGSYCLVGALNDGGQLTQFSLTPNQTSTLRLCGNVAAYVPATPDLVGSITISAAVIPIAQGASFTGTAVGVGNNLCFTLTLNGLSQIVSGVVAANTGQGDTGVPVAVCGTVSSYVAATSTDQGALSLILSPDVNVAYSIPAGTAISTTIATGSSICVSGVVTANKLFVTVAISANATSTLTECGIVGVYILPSGPAPGSLTLGSTVIPVAQGATFTGKVVTGQSVCLGMSLNGLGQLVSATLTVSTPTSTPGTVTITPATSTSTVTPTLSPPPPPASATPTITATPTATVVPTFTPIPTATATTEPSPTPTPKPKVAQIASASVRYAIIRIGTVEHIAVQAKLKTVQHIDVHVFFATGRHLDYSERTDRRGRWSKDFRVPADTISKYSNEAVVTFQLLKNHTAARDYRYFFVVR